MGKKMKVAEFIKREDDLDVYDNVCEEIGIAFCGPLKLTAEGKLMFADVLEYEIDVDEDYGCAIVNVDLPDWETRLRNAKRFFYAAAGYCDADDWDRWFKD